MFNIGMHGGYFFITLIDGEMRVDVSHFFGKVFQSLLSHASLCCWGRRVSGNLYLPNYNLVSIS